MIVLYAGTALVQAQNLRKLSDIQYIFVHGRSSWGSYDTRYRFMPYWGMFGGDLIRYLKKQGYSSYAASVAPEGSAWDRACELYAQLSGTVVDYGKAHSEKYRHDRYGRDFSKDPLIPDWDAGRKIVLLGHSIVFAGRYDETEQYPAVLHGSAENDRSSAGPALGGRGFA